MNVLDLKENVPAHRRGELHDEIGAECDDDPTVIRHPQRDRHLRAFFRIVKNPVEDGEGDRDLE